MNLDSDGDGVVSDMEIKKANDWFGNARIRQLIAVSLTGLVIFETIIPKTIEASHLLGIYGTILGFYFGSEK